MPPRFFLPVPPGDGMYKKTFRRKRNLNDLHMDFFRVNRYNKHRISVIENAADMEVPYFEKHLRKPV
jgi:hypothetical protein